MFESIYVGLTGLSSFSRHLTVIGNNVSNLNSPGFKASQLAFADLMYSQMGSGAGGSMQLGSGVGAGSTRTLFTQGTLRETGNPTDLAVDGNGFFVLRDADRTTYTRAGDFEFDANGYLVSRRNGARVAAFAGGGLRDFNISALRATPAKATTTVRLLDNLSSGDTAHQTTATVIDSAGTSHTLTLAFTNNNGNVARSWLLEVRDAAGNVLSNGQIRFNGDGSPTAGFNSHAFTFTPPGTAPSQIVLSFGDPGSFAGATHFSAGSESSLRVGSHDGFAAGVLTQASFDENGVLTATYSNGQTRRGPQIALAFFESPEALELVGNGLFENRSRQRATVGAAGSGVLGDIAGESLEGANVDLAQQFSELIITQRGYQASSQVITAANEMIQQLFEIKGRR